MNILKKHLTILTAAVVFLMEMPAAIPAHAEEMYDGLKYTVNVEGTITITGCEASVSEVEIPSEINNVSVTEIGNHAFAECTGLTAVTIPEGVTEIGYCAFYSCHDLTSVTIPKSVTWIDYQAFDGCSDLADIYYTGTEVQWNEIGIGAGSDPLFNAVVHFNAVLSSELVPTLGDINADQDINASDAAAVLMAAAQIGAGEAPDLTEAQQSAADVNGDGTVDASDATVILMYAAAVGAGETQLTIEEFMRSEKQSVDGLIESMTLDEKIHQMFIITPEALAGTGRVTAFGDASRQAMNEHPVAGLIYFASNLETVAQTRGMLTDTQDYAEGSTGIGMFLAVDEEGGRVARVASKLGTTKISSMQTYGNRGSKEEAFSAGSTIGSDIYSFGFNLDFAPVADVNLCAGNELGDRIFSSDPELVGHMVEGVTQGLQSAGVAATLKHFPGLGAEDGNAHTDKKIVINRSLDELREAEFVPFRMGIAAGADFVMVSHQIVTGVGDDLPASLSNTVCTELLRGELGFDGIIITDSFQMNTISGSYTSAEAAVMAIQAGVDIVLMPKNFEEALQGVRDAVANGTIPEQRIDESVRRVLAEKEKLGLLSPPKSAVSS